MTRALFDRRWQVTVGDLDVSELDLEFTIQKDTKRTPNEAQLVIYNMNEDSRSRAENTTPRRVVIRAGYKQDGDPPPTLFVGDARRVYSEVDGLDVITEVEARDAGNAWINGRMSKSYAPGVSVSRVLRDAVEILGIGEGNIDDFADQAMINGASTFPDGFVATGPARLVIQEIVRGQGLRWSVQGGALQIMRRRQPLQRSAVLLRAGSGLLGSPTKDEKGVVTAAALIRPGLDPGRRIVLESRNISGSFEIRAVEVRGSTRDNDWSATLTLRPLS